jgi:hypothetical protein
LFGDSQHFRFLPLGVFLEGMGRKWLVDRPG